jgi:hypothetical protein
MIEHLLLVNHQQRIYLSSATTNTQQNLCGPLLRFLGIRLIAKTGGCHDQGRTRQKCLSFPRLCVKIPKGVQLLHDPFVQVIHKRLQRSLQAVIQASANLDYKETKPEKPSGTVRLTIANRFWNPSTSVGLFVNFCRKASLRLWAGSVEMMSTRSLTAARRMAKEQLHVVFPTPPFPPQKIHFKLV